MTNDKNDPVGTYTNIYYKNILKKEKLAKFINNI